MPTLESGATAATLFTGSGTEESPYLIQSATDLAKLSVLTAGADYGATTEYFKLTTSIDLSVGGWLPICHRGVFTGTSWKYFLANFDGDGHTIIFNETISGQGFGLFEGIKGTVSNLVFSGNITANNRAGATAYHGSTGTIKNVYNYVSITTTGTGSVYAGGVVGTNGELIENCVNYAEINCVGGNTVGGITGSNAKSIKNCINYANISAGQYVGGITGNTSGTTIENCTNYGNVTGTSSAVGGISGQFASSSVGKLCVNYGKVSGAGNTGGIGGYMGNGSHIYACTNYGDVSSSVADGGGIVGENKGDVNTITIEETTYYNYNYGNVEGLDNVGGITGYQAASTGLTNGAYNYGNISGTGSCVGGVVGLNSAGTVSNCKNEGTVYAEGSFVGGVVGENKSSGSVSYCENRGGVSADVSYIGGVIGRNDKGTLASYLTNYGTVKANNYQSKTGTGIGGVIGSNQNYSPADNLTNYGDVYGYTQVGGISGYQGAGSSITTCSNSGNVFGYGTVGQTVGTNNGDVTGNTESGSVTDYEA